MARIIHLLIIITALTDFLIIHPMETTELDKSFKVFIIKNTCYYNLYCQVQDNCGENAVDLVHADSPNEIIIKKQLVGDDSSKSRLFILQPKKTAVIILFNNIEEHKKVLFPLSISIGEPSISYCKLHNLLSFQINDNDDRKTFRIEEKPVSNLVLNTGLIAYVKDIKNNTITMRSHQERDRCSNKTWLEYDKENDNLRAIRD